MVELSSRWDTTEQWRSLDSLFYTWFPHRNVTAERYVLMEYDCRCTAPLREAYGEVWDAAVACRSFYTPESKPDWHWFRRDELDKLPAEDRPFAGAVVPFACALFSHEAAERLVECATSEDVFCELRLGTAVLRAGLEPVEFPSPLRDGVFATPTEIDMSRPGVFHPVKAREVYEKNMRERRRRESGWLGRLRVRLGI